MIIHSGQELQAIHDCEPGDQLELDLASGRSATFTFSRVLTPQGVVEVIFHPLGQRNSFHLSEISRARKIDPFVPTPCTDVFLDPADVTAAILGSDPEVPLILYMEKDTHYLGSARILEEGRIFEFTDLAGNPYKLPMNRVVSISHLSPEARWGSMSQSLPAENALPEHVAGKMSLEPGESAEVITESTEFSVKEIIEVEINSSPSPISEMELAEFTRNEPLAGLEPDTVTIEKLEPIELDDEPDELEEILVLKAAHYPNVPLSAIALPPSIRGNSYDSPADLVAEIGYSPSVTLKALKGNALSIHEVEDALFGSDSYWLGTIQFKNGIVASGGLAVNRLRGTGRIICPKELWSVNFSYDDVHKIIELRR